MKNLLCGMLSCAALAGVCSVAHAQDDEVRVSYADLDLSRPADARLFDRRAQRTAEAYCSSGAGLDALQCSRKLRGELEAALPPLAREAFRHAMRERGPMLQAQDYRSQDHGS
jgi:UrcA family protein